MKQLNLLIIILFYALAQEVIAQHIKVTGGVGIGFYNLKEYRNLNDNTLAALPVQGQLISNFPGRIFPEAAIVYETPYKNLAKIALNWSFHSTGSRVSYTDYSGSYLFDQTITFSNITTEFGYRLYNYNSYDLLLNAGLGIQSGKYKSNENIDLYGINFKNEEIISNFIVLNSLVLAEFIHHSNYLNYGFRFGYHYPLLELVVEKSSTPKPQSAGIRFSVCVGYRIY
jgi:hypothetical protein